MLKFKNQRVVEVQDWDDLVKSIYGRTYSYQQQDGCRDRGIVYITVPSKYADESQMNNSIPEVVNGSKRGVKFATWLSRDPNTPIANQQYDWELRLFWQRSFYPDLDMVINDLHEKGLIEAGDYIINIDW